MVFKNIRKSKKSAKARRASRKARPRASLFTFRAPRSRLPAFGQGEFSGTKSMRVPISAMSQPRVETKFKEFSFGMATANAQ